MYVFNIFINCGENQAIINSLLKIVDDKSKDTDGNID